MPQIKIDHLALWVKDLEKMKRFYQDHFQTTASDLYHNSKTNFYSYFLSFKSGARLELMNKPDLIEKQTDVFGYAHIALSVGSKEDVDQFAKVFKAKNVLLNGPRITGDGYYEAVIQDPEGNLIELTAEPL